MTGLSRAYYIYSAPNGNKFDESKIKENREKILTEIEDQEDSNGR